MQVYSRGPHTDHITLELPVATRSKGIATRGSWHHYERSKDATLELPVSHRKNHPRLFVALEAIDCGHLRPFHGGRLRGTDSVLFPKPSMGLAYFTYIGWLKNVEKGCEYIYIYTIP